MIEDDPTIGRALLTALREDGHVVVWLQLAADVELRLLSGHFNAVLLDLGLPDRDGHVVLRRLRAVGISVPVLIMTARDSLQDRLDGFNNGADDYLIKPFDIPELLARLRAMARRCASTLDDAGPVVEAIGLPVGESQWTLRDLVIAERRMQVTRAGALVPLSRTEFMLLLALIKESDRVLTRLELERRVLPLGGGQTLDVHIFNLRRKIGAGYIRTVRGIGYIAQHDDPA